MVRPLRILHFDGEHRYVFSIGGDLVTVRREDELGGGAGGLALDGHDLLSALIAARFD